MWDITSNDHPCDVDQKCKKYKQSKARVIWKLQSFCCVAIMGLGLFVCRMLR